MRRRSYLADKKAKDMIAEQVARNEAKRQELQRVSSFQNEVQPLNRVDTSHAYAKRASREMKISKQNSKIIIREEAKIAKTRGNIAAAKIQESTSLSKWNTEIKQQQKRARVRNSAIERGKMLTARYKEKKKIILEQTQNRVEQDSGSRSLSAPISPNKHLAEDDSVDYVHWFREHIEKPHGMSIASNECNDDSTVSSASCASCIESVKENIDDSHNNECGRNNLCGSSIGDGVSFSNDLHRPPSLETISLHTTITEKENICDRSSTSKDRDIDKPSQQVEMPRLMPTKTCHFNIISMVVDESPNSRSFSLKEEFSDENTLDLEVASFSNDIQKQQPCAELRSLDDDSICFPPMSPTNEISPTPKSSATIMSEEFLSTPQTNISMASQTTPTTDTRCKMKRLGVLMARIDKTNALFSPSVDRLKSSLFGGANNDCGYLECDGNVPNAEQKKTPSSNKTENQSSNRILHTQEKLKKLKSIVCRLSENHQSMHPSMVLLEKDSERLELCTTNVEKVLEKAKNKSNDGSASSKQSVGKESIDVSCGNLSNAFNSSIVDETQLFSLVERHVNERIPESPKNDDGKQASEWQ